VAEQKSLPFTSLRRRPAALDGQRPKRLQQILKNLLSNAVKFTAHGHVEVRVGWRAGWSPTTRAQQDADQRWSPSRWRTPASASRPKSSA
jgi:signal transduction histidine kinase